MIVKEKVNNTFSFFFDNSRKKCYKECMAEGAAASSIRFVVKDIVLDVLLFPFWWYTTGAVQIFRWFLNRIRRASRAGGLRIWFRNFFKPMYGDYSFEGRLISFGMRSVVSVWKLVSFLLSFLVAAVATLLYALAPLVAVWYLLFQLCGVPFPILQ